MNEVSRNDFINMLYKFASEPLDIKAGDIITTTINGKTLKITVEDIKNDSDSTKQEPEEDKSFESDVINGIKIAYVDTNYFDDDYDSVKNYIETNNINIIIDKQYKDFIEIFNTSAEKCVEFSIADLKKVIKLFDFDEMYIGSNEFALARTHENHQEVIIGVDNNYILHYNVQEDEEAGTLYIKACEKHIEDENAEYEDENAEYEDENAEYEDVVYFTDDTHDKVPNNAVVIANHELKKYSFMDGAVDLNNGRGFMILKMHKDDVMIDYHLNKLVIYDGAPDSPFNIEILGVDSYHFEVWEQDNYLLVCVVLDNHQINTEKGEQV